MNDTHKAPYRPRDTRKSLEALSLLACDGSREERYVVLSVTHRGTGEGGHFVTFIEVPLGEFEKSWGLPRLRRRHFYSEPTHDLRVLFGQLIVPDHHVVSQEDVASGSPVDSDLPATPKEDVVVRQGEGRSNRVASHRRTN